MNYQMRVYRYRIRGDLPEVVLAELRRAHDLANRLVEHERRHAERVEEIWASAGTLTEALAERDRASELVDQLVEAAADERQRGRERKVSPELRAQMAEARRVLRDARAAVRAAKQESYERLKPLFAAARDELKAAIKAEYRAAVDAGLYWASYNEVVARHRRAVSAVAERREQGLAADLRFRRWTGEGTIAVQLQRGAGQPARTPQMLADPASPRRNVAALTPAIDPTQWATLTRGEQRRLARTGRLRFRIGSGDAAELVEVPVILHRPIPPDADVTMLRITRELVAGKARCWVSVVCRVPEVPAVESGRQVRVHAGWRSLGDGDLRVAVVEGCDAPPEWLVEQGWVRWHGEWGEVCVPAHVRQVWERGHELRSQRDRNLDELRDWLRSRDDLDDEVREALARWRSPARWAALAQRRRGDGSEIGARLEAWRRQDHHLWQWEAHERDQIVARRDDAWRAVAAWLCDGTAEVMVDEWGIDRRVPAVEDPDGHQERRARANAVVAAPGKLRELVGVAASGRGVQVVAGPGRLDVHHVCGTPLDRSGRARSVMVRCEHCDALVDQDRNALALMGASGRVAA